MSFGNVPRDFSVSSLSVLRSTAAKSINGLFSADIRQVGSLVQYQRSPDIWVTADSLTVPATQLGNLYTLPASINELSLNLDGSTLAVGLATPAAGSLLSILTNTAGFYAQQVIPLPPDAVALTYGSVSLSDSGNILAFGSGSDNGGVGAVWIYLNVAGVWTLQGPKITGPGEIGLGNFGQQISLSGSGSLLAVSSFSETPAGAAYIFNLNSPTSPVFVTRIVVSPSLYPNVVFGKDVAFSADGSTLAVGASSTLSTNGPVFIFTKVQTQWQQQAYITIPDGFSTQYFAYNVSLSADGNILVVSSSANAVVYYRQGLTGPWSPGNLLPIPFDSVGSSTQSYAIISHDGNSICTSGGDNNNNVGASWIFTQGPLGTWTQNGPALIGTGAPILATQQGYSQISGNGKVAAVQDNSAQALLWLFV